ncbi:MAG: sugar phosphate isomerase/epimerase family protein [Flavobacteriaceae bacterium]
MKRRKFLQQSLTSGIGITTLGAYAMKHNHLSTPAKQGAPQAAFFKLSLAQWSLHRTIQNKKISPYDFAEQANKLGFSGIEYVNQLYTDVMAAKNKPAALKQFIKNSNTKAKQFDVENVLIMIDNEGDLAVAKKKERRKAINNHKIWVEAAAEMNCSAIRLNLFGETDPSSWKDYAAESMMRLGEYAAAYDINVLVENHGYLSSNAALVMEMLNQVNRTNCGTLPDFGNFCLERENGERWDTKCIREYNRYQGVQEMMPRAFAVSAKSHDFNAEGNEINTDYLRMLKLVKAAGYTGFIGVEYEGQQLSEREGILATKKLLLKQAKHLV